MRLTIALLLYFEDSMKSKDIVELSLMMKDIRETSLQSVEEQDRLFSLLLSLTAVRFGGEE